MRTMRTALAAALMGMILIGSAAADAPSDADAVTYVVVDEGGSPVSAHATLREAIVEATRATDTGGGRRLYVEVRLRVAVRDLPLPPVAPTPQAAVVNVAAAMIHAEGRLVVTWLDPHGFTGPVTMNSGGSITLRIDPGGPNERTVSAITSPMHTPAALSTSFVRNDTLTAAFHLSGDAHGHPEHTGPHAGETVQIASISAGLFRAGAGTAGQSGVPVTNESAIAKPTAIVGYLTRKYERITGTTVDVYALAHHRYPLNASHVTAVLEDAGGKRYTATVTPVLLEPRGDNGAGAPVEAYRLRFDVTGGKLGPAVCRMSVRPPLACPVRTVSRDVYLDPASAIGEAVAYVDPSRTLALSDVGGDVPAGTVFTGQTSGTRGVTWLPLTRGSGSMRFLWWLDNVAFVPGETLEFANGVTARAPEAIAMQVHGSEDPALGERARPFQTVAAAAQAIADAMPAEVGKHPIGTIRLMGAAGGVGVHSMKGHQKINTSDYVPAVHTHLSIERDTVSAPNLADVVLADFIGSHSPGRLGLCTLLKGLSLRVYDPTKTLFSAGSGDPFHVAVESCHFKGSGRGAGYLLFQNAKSLWYRDFLYEDSKATISIRTDQVHWDSTFRRSDGDFAIFASHNVQAVVANCHIDDYEGQKKGNHTDIFQWTGGINTASNVIVASTKITNNRYQCVFIGHTASIVSNIAFVNVLFEATDDGDVGSAPLTIGGNKGGTDHLLIWHCTAVRTKAGSGSLGGAFNLVGGPHTNLSVRNCAFSGVNIHDANTYVFPNVVNIHGNTAFGVRPSAGGTFPTLWAGPYSTGAYPSDATSWAARRGGPLDNRLLEQDIILERDLAGRPYQVGGSIGAYGGQ